MNAIEVMKQVREKLIAGDLLCELVAVSMLDEAIKREEAQTVEPVASGEREELIKNLREASYSIDGEVADHITETVIKAADMLAAYAKEVSATELQVEILSDELSKLSKLINHPPQQRARK